MDNVIELSEEAFAALFKPVANHLNPNASFDWGDGYGTMFETFDEELAYVRTQDAAKVWTLLSGDGGDHVASGYHFVNRLGYFITEVAVPDGVHILVNMPQTTDSVDWPPLPQCVADRLHSIVEYPWKDEKNDYLASSIPCRKRHIFRSLCLVRKWLNSQ